MKVKKNPGDEGRRDRERRARAEGGVEAEAARLAAELRAGRLTSVAVELAAALGDPAAVAVADPRHVRGWVEDYYGEPSLASRQGSVLRHLQHGWREFRPAVSEAFTRSWERVSEVARQDHGYMQSAHFASAQGQWQNAFRDLRLAYEHVAVRPWDGAFEAETQRQANDLIALLLGRPLS